MLRKDACPFAMGRPFGQPSSWLGFCCAMTASADARGRHYRHRHAAVAGESYEPSTSSIVVDVNSGAVMQATNADAPRHPASLTKIMTLYMVFDGWRRAK